MTMYGMPYLMECGSPQACAALCRELGLDFVELNFSFPGCNLSTVDAGRLRRMKDEYGIGFTIHMDEMLQPCAAEPVIAETYRKLACDVIRLAADAGCPSVNLHWERGVYVTLPDRRVFMNQCYRQDYLRSTAAFRDACAEASGGRVNVCIENTDGWLPFQQEAIELLLEAPCFGLTLDIGHDHCAGGMDRPFFQRHIDRLRHMHAHDALGQKCHNAFGTGEIDLRQRLAMARTAGANVVLQVKTVAALRDTVSCLPHYLTQEEDA